MFVIKNTETGKYVAKPGGKSSYTTKLEHARVYPNRESANGERCEGNEVAVSVVSLLGGE